MENIVQILLEEATSWVPKVGGVVVIFVVFFILARIIKRIITTNAERLRLDRSLTSLLARTSSITLIIFGTVTALGILGVNVSALVAGIGLTCFAIGFALKDTISNFLSGVLIYRPFEKGNRIKISGYEGIVIAMTCDIRSLSPRATRYSFRMQNYSRM